MVCVEEFRRGRLIKCAKESNKLNSFVNDFNMKRKRRKINEEKKKKRGKKSKNNTGKKKSGIVTTKPYVEIGPKVNYSE